MLGLDFCQLFMGILLLMFVWMETTQSQIFPNMRSRKFSKTLQQAEFFPQTLVCLRNVLGTPAALSRLRCPPGSPVLPPEKAGCTLRGAGSESSAWLSDIRRFFTSPSGVKPLLLQTTACSHFGSGCCYRGLVKTLGNWRGLCCAGNPCLSSGSREEKQLNVLSPQSIYMKHQLWMERLGFFTLRNGGEQCVEGNV